MQGSFPVHPHQQPLRYAWQRHGNNRHCSNILARVSFARPENCVGLFAPPPPPPPPLSKQRPCPRTTGRWVRQFWHRRFWRCTVQWVPLCAMCAV